MPTSGIHYVLGGNELPRRYTPTPVDAVVQSVGSQAVLVFGDVADLTSFSFHVLGFTTGTFVIERTLHANPATAPADAWTVVGAFKAGTRAARGVWVDSPGAYHGNCSASSAIRIRVTAALDAPATVRLIAGSGTGTITVGAIASNPDNIIGAVASLAEYYATGYGGRLVFNATTPLLTLSSPTTEQPIFAIINPAGSPVDVYVDRINSGATASSIRRRYSDSTLSALPAPLQILNRGGGTNGARAQVYSTGFTRTGGVLGKTAFNGGYTQETDDVAGSIVLRPGMNLSWSSSAPTLGTNTTYQAAMEVIWWELPAQA